MIVLTAAFCIIITVLLLIVLLCGHAKHRRSLPKCRRVLLVIAHPDDETMFFAPTLQGLRLSGSTIYLLCITTGNSDGFGAKRKYELANACKIHGISLDNVTILDYEYLQDGFVSWSREQLARIVLRHMQVLDVDMVITFDENGVSSHPNHIDCFRSLQYLYTNGLIPAGVQVFVLESVALWRKYLTAVDALISSCYSTFFYISSPVMYVRTWRAMLAHKSQLLWFRYLYMLFSRYILINTLKRIHVRPRHPVHKRKQK